MSKMKHTPGPWEIGGDDSLLWVTGTDKQASVVCDIVSRNTVDYSDEDRANAHLIAAAPDLLEALDSILSLGRKDTSNPKYDGYYEAARAAIAKAIQGDGNGQQ